MRLLIALILSAVVLSPAAGAATIHGVAYDYSLDLLKGAVLRINSTPEQSVVLSDGTYRIELPTGKYNLKAGYYSDGRLIMSDEQNVTIVDNGDYVIDLILLPELDFNESIFGGEQEIGDFEIDELEKNPEADYSLVIIVLLIILAALIIVYLMKPKKPATKEPAKGIKSSEIPEDLREVLDILKESGGRMNQKDLRNELPCSEAKVSLMVSDLEQRGLVKRFKKGRGNVIRLGK
jgi:uncharacterized membrane protein